MNLKKKILLLWVIFALLDPDPDPLTRLNPDPVRIRIRNPACGEQPGLHDAQLEAAGRPGRKYAAAPPHHAAQQALGYRRTLWRL